MDLLRALAILNLPARDGHEKCHQAEHLTGSVRFHVIDRHDSTVLALLLGGGADHLVDALCFTAADGD